MARSVTAVSDAMMDRARGALLGTLVGDALGRPFEGSPRSDRPRLERALRRRLEAPRAWLCSDDGEMMLALAEAIAAHRRVDEGDLLDSLARRLEPARGVGRSGRRPGHRSATPHGEATLVTGHPLELAERDARGHE